jgi:hypothetical protein
VLGKLGEIRLWLGPYSRPQLVVAGAGLLVLGKTIPLWWPVFGPLPLVGLGFAVWGARCARIGGRVPEAAVWGWILLLVQPRHGRIAGRPARDRVSSVLHGGFFFTEAGQVCAGDAVSARPFGSAVPGVRPARRSPALFVRSSQGRPALPRSGRSAGSRPSAPASGPAARSAAGAGPRSSLDLLLEQAGARSTTSKTKA